MAKAGTANPGVATSGSATGFTAMVLAGGLGLRLRSVVADRPKPLALVGDEPFLVRLLDQLAAAGCTDVVLCTGHLGEQIEREFGREHAGMRLHWSRETVPLGTGGALRLGLAHVADAVAAVLVANGDSYVDVDLADFVRTARASAGAAMLCASVADTARYGAVALDATQRVVGFTEKGRTGPGLVNAGVYWLPRAVLAALPAGQPAALETAVLPTLLPGGLLNGQPGGLLGVFTAAPFLDIGVPADYARAESFFVECAARRARPRKGLLVVDRDGTLIAEKHYLADPGGVELLPGVVAGLQSFVANGYDLAVVTNQSGVGRGYFDEAKLASVHAELRRQLADHGIELRGIWYCPHHPDAGCRCRKPEPELLETAMQQLGYRADEVLVVGDKVCDIELGARLGVRTALVRTGYGAGTEQDGRCTPDRIVDTLDQLAQQEIRS